MKEGYAPQVRWPSDDNNQKEEQEEWGMTKGEPVIMQQKALLSPVQHLTPTCTYLSKPGGKTLLYRIAIETQGKALEAYNRQHKNCFVHFFFVAYSCCLFPAG